MMWHDDGWGWGGWLAASLTMLLVWTVLVTAALLLARAIGQPKAGAGRFPDPTAAQRILDERFARGELTEDEYRHQREVLTAR